MEGGKEGRRRDGGRERMRAPSPAVVIISPFNGVQRQEMIVCFVKNCGGVEWAVVWARVEAVE